LETHLIVLRIHGWSLHDNESDGPFLMIMQVIFIFNRLRSKPYIEILSVQYSSLRHSEYFGPFPSDMHGISIFSRWSTRAHMSI
jgi:hypothetical protein